MSGLVLRLAGPLQAWGEHSAFGRRDTTRFPTRSGLIGLIASAEGRTRGFDLRRYEPLGFTVRIDRAGVVIDDFHTVGGGRPRPHTVVTAEGKRRSQDTATIVSRRSYLADSVFCVAVTGPQELVGSIAEALATPVWQPYLGRRSCPPDFPLYLRTSDDPVRDLETKVPVARFPDRDASGSIAIEFVTEGARDSSSTVTDMSDVPISFEHLGRRYGVRAVASENRPLPAELFEGRSLAYLTALHDYSKEG